MKRRRNEEGKEELLLLSELLREVLRKANPLNEFLLSVSVPVK